MIQQGTDEWRQQRLGLVTASRIADVMARNRGGFAATRQNYMMALITERLTGQPMQTYSNSAMEWGREKEGEARAAYAAKTGNIVEEVGFIRHQTLEAGASPDGYVGNDTIIEIKCPNSQTLVEWVENREIPQKYRLQIQFQLAVTGRDMAHFVGYDPRLPEHLRLLIIEEPRNNQMILEITAEVERFLGELNDKLSKFKRQAE
jgi:putative phage-type endonuclease